MTQLILLLSFDGKSIEYWASAVLCMLEFFSSPMRDKKDLSFSLEFSRSF